MSAEVGEEFQFQEELANDNENQDDPGNEDDAQDQAGPEQDGQDEDHDNSFIIKLRGLPWTVTNKDIVNFLKDIAIADGENGVHLITYSRNSTRPNGEAFVVCASEDDYKKSFYYNKKTIGKRYIEIFSARREDFENIMRKQNIVQHDTVVKLRGLPWRVTVEEIVKFFDGLELNKEKGVHIHLDRTGRASGEAFVQFESTEDCEKALKRNMEKIGHRYIEIFRSTTAELRRSMFQNSTSNDRPSPYDRNNRGDRGSRMNNFGGNDFGNNGRNNMRSMGGDRRGGGGNGGGRFGGGYSEPWNDNGNNIWNNRNDFGFGNGNGNGFGNNGNNGFGNFNNGNNSFGNNFGNNFGNDRFGNNGNNGGGNGGGGGGGNNGGNNLGFGGGMFGGNNGNNGSNGYGALNTLGFGGLSDLRNNRGGGGGGGFGNNNSLGGNNFGNMGGGNNNCGNDMNDFFCIHLRGMPYYCDEMDIMKFFSPLKPVHCNVIYNNKGIHSGGGNAWFKTHDEAEEAMKRDKDKMGSRYIELFYDNPPSNKNRRRF